MRVARLTAVYVLCVSLVVLPITLRAAALAGYVSESLTGNSETAPGLQKAMGGWARDFVAAVDGLPNLVSLPVRLAAIGAFASAVLRRGGERT